MKRKSFRYLLKTCKASVQKNLAPKRKSILYRRPGGDLLWAQFLSFCRREAIWYRKLFPTDKKPLLKRILSAFIQKLAPMYFFEIFIEIGANINLNHHLNGHMQRISNLGYTTFQVFQLVKVFQSILRKEHI